jgi:hypothetical protein
MPSAGQVPSSGASPSPRFTANALSYAVSGNRYAHQRKSGAQPQMSKALGSGPSGQPLQLLALDWRSPRPRERRGSSRSRRRRRADGGPSSKRDSASPLADRASAGPRRSSFKPIGRASAASRTSKIMIPCYGSMNSRALHLYLMCGGRRSIGLYLRRYQRLAYGERLLLMTTWERPNSSAIAAHPRRSQG